MVSGITWRQSTTTTSCFLFLALAFRLVRVGGPLGGVDDGGIDIFDIAQTLILLRATITLLIKLMLLGKDAPLALAKGIVVLGLETR